MGIIKNIAYILTIIGGLNWGLVGGFGFNLVTYLFGDLSLATQITYILVGLSAIILMFCTTCGMGSKE